MQKRIKEPCLTLLKLEKELSGYVVLCEAAVNKDKWELFNGYLNLRHTVLHVVIEGPFQVDWPESYYHKMKKLQ